MWVLEGKREGPYEKKGEPEKNHQKKTSCQNENGFNKRPSFNHHFSTLLSASCATFSPMLDLSHAPCFHPQHWLGLLSCPLPKMDGTSMGGCPVLPDDRNSSSGAPRKPKGASGDLFRLLCLEGWNRTLSCHWKGGKLRHSNQHFCRRKSIMPPCNTFLWGTEVTSSVTIS